jgi:hypothetical protein
LFIPVATYTQRLPFVGAAMRLLQQCYLLDSIAFFLLCQIDVQLLWDVKWTLSNPQKSEARTLANFPWRSLATEARTTSPRKEKPSLSYDHILLPMNKTGFPFCQFSGWCPVTGAASVPLCRRSHCPGNTSYGQIIANLQAERPAIFYSSYSSLSPCLLSITRIDAHVHWDS